jgi:TolA-binding protein
MITLRRLLPVAVLGVVACATPGQVRRVETQVLMGQQEQHRADSARAAELGRLLGQQQRLMDSLLSLAGALQARLGQLDVNSQAAMEDVRRDISVLTQSMNVSQQKIAQIRSDIEARQAATGGDSTAGGASDDALNRAANQELLAGRYQTAREAFHELLTRFPNSPYGPTAYIRIGGTFEQSQPDSARAYYQMVLKLPASQAAQTAAPTALWKLGQLEERRGNSDAAKGFYQQIVDKFPNSAEFTQAQLKVRKP